MPPPPPPGSAPDIVICTVLDELRIIKYIVCFSIPKITLHGVILLILISGDIAENPDPIKFLCGSCAKPVKKNQKGIQCEDCLFWYHIKSGHEINAGPLARG